MIHSGVKPVRKDHRDRSYPRTFGTTTTFPDELNLDVGFGFPDQNADGYPNGCTGYTQADIAADEDTIEYQPRFTYDKTRMMEGTYPEDVGCDIRDSLESTIAYGLLAKGEATDDQAGFHRRGAYYNVVDDPNLDAFDDVRSAIATNRRSVSCVTPWFAEWEYPVKGVIAAPKTLTGYHNWKICGWTQIAGTPYLIGKSWQGPRYGDGGYHYVSREIFNAVMAMPGSGCFTLRKAVAADYARVKLAIFQTVLSYMRLWLISLFSHPMPQTLPEPQNTPSQPVSPSPDSDTVPPTVPESETPGASPLDTFCTAIRDFEGSPGDLNYRNNNPGNCRCSPQGYLAKYGNVRCVGNFAVFETYELGWEYLQALVSERVKAHPTWTFSDFFASYAPTSDGNSPKTYAAFVAKRCGVAVDSRVADFLA